MIDQTDQRIEEWIKSILGQVPVSFDTAKPTEARRGVSLFLLEVTPDSVARQARELPPLKLNLRYVVAPWAENAQQTHRMLGDLMLAAMQHLEFTVVADAAPHSFWQSHNQPIRPSFLLQAPLLHHRPTKQAPKVTQAVIIRQSPLVPLVGRVLGPGEVGIMDALVEAPSLNMFTRTDAEGRFRFAAVPTDPPLRHLRVHAKGRRIDLEPETSPTASQPFLIHLTESQL